MVISQNTVIVKFHLILVTFQAGIMDFSDFHTLLPVRTIDPCEQNKERTYGLK